jgi:hypothetical protein
VIDHLGAATLLTNRLIDGEPGSPARYRSQAYANKDVEARRSVALVVAPL